MVYRSGYEHLLVYKLDADTLTQWAAESARSLHSS